MKVVVLGVSGMLGHMVARVLAESSDLEVVGSCRQGRIAPVDLPRRVRLVNLDVEQADETMVASQLDGAHWVVNAVGLIKSSICDTSPDDVEQALRVNALFPHRLARAAEGCGARVLQIATDCVYSGATGGYTETSPHDAHDVYGKTKSLGEVNASHVHHLRASIVGPECRRHVSLLEWFLRQRPSASVPGFTSHRWNGVTTLHFARVCDAIIRGGMSLPRLFHLVPADCVTKHELLQQFGRSFGRNDIAIRPTSASPPIDRTLQTENTGLAAALWTAAGYSRPPTVAEMVDELAAAMPVGVAAA